MKMQNDHYASFEYEIAGHGADEPRLITGTEPDKSPASESDGFDPEDEAFFRSPPGDFESGLL